MVQSKNVELLRSDLDKIYAAVELIQQGKASAPYTTEEEWENRDSAEKFLFRIVKFGKLGEAIELIGALLRLSYSETYMLKSYQKRTTHTNILNQAMIQGIEYANEWSEIPFEEVKAIFEVEAQSCIDIMYKINIYDRYTRLIALVIAYILVCLTDYDIK